MTYIIDVDIASEKITKEKVFSIKETIENELNSSIPSIVKINLDVIGDKNFKIEIETDEKIDTNTIEKIIKNSLIQEFPDINIIVTSSYTEGKE